MELRELSKYLRSKVTGKTTYAIPRAWVPKGYGGRLVERGPRVFVDPYEYHHFVVSSILDRAVEADYSKSLAQIRGESKPTWINRSVIYGALVRTTAAYNHKGFGAFEPDDILGFRESGTFLKMIAILPYLVGMGVNVLYLLPISKMSQIFKKGEIGSPYAVKNPVELDESYGDPLLEGVELDVQFKALVEAAHVLGVRVVLDFIPRTAARDSDLILEHPDWFYWIRVEEAADYGPPRVPSLAFKIPDPGDLETLYASEEVKRHLRKFAVSPDRADPERWEKVKRMGGNVLSNIVREFGIITPPGFSDWINDPQPTWDDVTFLRLYLDHPALSAAFVPEDQPPYVLFDVIKSSRFPGKVPNHELWEYISNVIPSYQRRFGIDGARIDMGHALPPQLQDLIIAKVREIDPAFALIAEELEMKNDVKAKNEGYDCILGNSWYAVARPAEFYRFIEEIAPNVKLPFIASCETPDTPRIVAREHGDKLKYLAPALLYFAPNAVPYVNSGQELEEPQPMNLGLDNTLAGKTMLPLSDQFYAKLAFFDHYALHWDCSDGGMYRYLAHLFAIRSEFSELMDGEFRYVYLDHQDGTIANYSYWKGDRGLILLGNLSFEAGRRVEILLRETAGRELHVDRVEVIKAGGRWSAEVVNGNFIPLHLDPGEFAVIVVN